MVIDDEELARLLLKSYIEKCDFLALKGSFNDPIEALSALKSNQIDLVFLDIQMPDLKGTDFAKLVMPTTKIIFTTAYSEYALDGYELDALDYLLKPITFNRFLRAVNKLQPNTIIDLDKSITVKSGYDFHKLKLNEITHIESNGEYVMFHTAKKKIMSYQSLKSLEKSLDEAIFMRVHRSFMVNKTKVTGLKNRMLLLANLEIPVSDSYYDAVKEDLF